ADPHRRTKEISMPTRAPGTRNIALMGPGGAGKTSLAEALLFAAGAIGRQGSVADGSSTGDASPEARARGGSTELNLMHFDYLGDHYVLTDCPGSVGFAADGAMGAAVADLAIVVVDPDPDRALLAEPTLRQLEAQGIPHMIFVNKIDQARGSIQGLLEALQPMSASPLIAEVPDRETVFADLAKETGAGQIVPVLFGSATGTQGIRRLMKALRHEAPAPSAAAERLGASGSATIVFKVSHGGAMGRLSYARVFGAGLKEGQELVSSG